MTFWLIQGSICRMLRPYRGNIFLGNLKPPTLGNLDLRIPQNWGAGGRFGQRCVPFKTTSQHLLTYNSWDIFAIASPHPQPLLPEREKGSRIEVPLPSYLSLPTSIKKLRECLTNALDLALAS